MTYLGWAIFAEGKSDIEYLSVIIPRVIGHIISFKKGGMATIPEVPSVIFGQAGRSFDVVSKEICDAKDAFFLLFVHGDTGGRNLQQSVDDRTTSLVDRCYELCGVDRDRCVLIRPKQETEAWCLADIKALRSTFNLSDNFDFVEIPENPALLEAIADPKSLMKRTVERADRRTRRVPYAAISSNQNINTLLLVPSFKQFFDDLTKALSTFGYE